jgi:hypothetical protein
VDVVEIAALEPLKALAQLLADPWRGRPRQLPEPGLLAQRLDIAHRQAADERADHHRPARLGAQPLGPARKQHGDQRLARLADLGYLDLKLALRRLHPARPEAVAQSRRRLRPPPIPRAAQPRVELVLDRALDDQPGTEPASSDSASRGFSPTPTASTWSICSSISADGRTVRLTA